MLAIAKKIFGSSNDRKVKAMLGRGRRDQRARAAVRGAVATTSCAPRPRSSRPASPAGETLDDLLNEAFAVVREAAKRTLGQRHYDVQLVGGMVLHNGGIAEMRTGEGKTLVATLPVYLNALAGKGVHVVTVNDYLANRDAEWMGRVYRFLGMTVGRDRQRPVARASASAPIAADITYGTNNEFGFDYLRDNLVYRRRRDGPARPPLRHRRRGGLDPDRRGAHAADHLGPDRGPLGVLPHHRQAWCAS